MAHTPGFRRLGRDRHVMFAVRYADGTSAYIRVKPASVEHGNSVVTDIAREAQQRGEIPAGTIVGVKRVR